MESKTINISDLAVHYLETNGQNKIPLVILHGWGSSTDSWANVAVTLEGEGVKVFIPDLPGFGKTPEPPQVWGCSEYLDFIKAFAREFGIGKFTLAGHSFGGQLAIAYAAKYPNDLNMLILMAPARIVKRKKLKVRMFLFATKIGNLIFSLPPLSHLRPLVQKIWYKFTGEQDYYRASPHMQEIFRRVLGEEVGSSLEMIKIPTLILWGDRDYVTPYGDAHFISSKISASQLYTFFGVGHDLNIKRSREVAQKIVEFINNQ